MAWLLQLLIPQLSSFRSHRTTIRSGTVYRSSAQCAVLHPTAIKNHLGVERPEVGERQISAFVLKTKLGAAGSKLQLQLWIPLQRAPDPAVHRACGQTGKAGSSWVSCEADLEKPAGYSHQVAVCQPLLRSIHRIMLHCTPHRTACCIAMYCARTLLKYAPFGLLHCTPRG